MRRKRDDGYEILQSLVENIGIRFKVNKHVCRRRGRQCGEPVALLDVAEQFVNEPTLLATLHLKSCLLADAQQGGISDAFNLRLRGKSQLREVGYGAHPASSQRLPLIPRNSRDERQVVVSPA